MAGRRPRFHVHYTPTYTSWLSQVEIWSNVICRQEVRSYSFLKVSELVEWIERFASQWNASAQPIVRTATADSNLGEFKRFANASLWQDTGTLFGFEDEPCEAEACPERNCDVPRLTRPSPKTP